MRKGICSFLLGAFIFVPIVTERSVVVVAESSSSSSSSSWSSHTSFNKKSEGGGGDTSILSDTEYKFHQQQPSVSTSYGYNGIPKIQGQAQTDEGNVNPELLIEGSSSRSRFPAIPASASGASAATSGTSHDNHYSHSQDQHGTGSRPEQLIPEVKITMYIFISLCFPPFLYLLMITSIFGMRDKNVL